MEYKIRMDIDTNLVGSTKRPIHSSIEFQCGLDGMEKLLRVVNELSELQLSLKDD